MSKVLVNFARETKLAANKAQLRQNTRDTDRKLLKVGKGERSLVK